MDLHDALDRFLHQLRADGRSEHTLGQFRRHVLLLARWAARELRSSEAKEFDHQALARFLGSTVATRRADGRPKTAASVNALRVSLRGFFGYLHRAGFLPEDPSRLVRLASCGAPPPRTLTEGDQRRLLDALRRAKSPAGRRDHALFHLLLATGVRIGSALALEVGDVDLEAGELRLRRVKGGRGERVFLTPELQSHLREFLRDRPEGPLFVGRRGARLSARHVRRRLALWLERSGSVVVSPHALRHSFAMGLYRRTRDLLLVRRALGHRSIESTLRYAHAQDDDLRLAMGDYHSPAKGLKGIRSRG